MTEPTQPGPAHIGIIMDGNGRWATARGLPRLAGHKSGADAVRRTIKAAIKLNIKVLTLYSFSTENWQRPPEEVGDLMGLLRLYLKSELPSLHKEGVRIRIIGEQRQLPEDIRAQIAEAESLTAGNTSLTLVMALSYGARQEIVAAAQNLAADVAAKRIAESDITPELFAQRLYTSGLPDPDIIIRTSGEQRLSNFLLWQSAYAEFVFMDVLWPDFEQSHLETAISEYQHRERRFGRRSCAAGKG